MNKSLRSPEDYELFLYTLKEQFPIIKHSTVIFIRRGATLGRVEGEIIFPHGLRLVVRERILFNRLPVVIDWYGYEVWQDNEKWYWYDSQPHPDVPALQITHPHHKHVPPNPKQNRIPASAMSFVRPNLPKVIEEISEIISKLV